MFAGAFDLQKSLSQCKFPNILSAGTACMAIAHTLGVLPLGNARRRRKNVVILSKNNVLDVHSHPFSRMAVINAINLFVWQGML